jgi:hypothetical protein
LSGNKTNYGDFVSKDTELSDDPHQVGVLSNEDTNEVWETSREEVIKNFRRNRPKTSRENECPLHEIHEKTWSDPSDTVVPIVG